MRVGLLLALALALVSCGGGGEEPAKRPNIVFVLADDLGWKDVGYAGSAYATPNIDRLAARGMTFTQAYSASPACSPTRASLLTGRHPARLHITKAIRNKDYQDAADGVIRATGTKRRFIQPESKVYLPFTAPSFAKELRNVGYDTAFFGKWHLGLPPYMPARYGFDTVIAAGPFSASPYFPPYQADALPEVADGTYLTDFLTDLALEFLRRDRDGPFLLYLSHFAVHVPLTAKPELVAEQERALPPDGDQRDPVYGAMIQSLDESVGRILDALDELGLAEDTLVVFTSDNGPFLGEETTLTTTAPLRGGKLDLYEGGIRVPTVAAWPGTIEAGSTSATPVISMDFFPTFVGLGGGQAVLESDGVDLAPLFGGGALERDTLHFHFPHRELSCAIRQGDEKLVHFFAGRDELYDLADDPGETNDLAESRPERARELREELLVWLGSVGAGLPTPNPGYAPR